MPVAERERLLTEHRDWSSATSLNKVQDDIAPALRARGFALAPVQLPWLARWLLDAAVLRREGPGGTILFDQLRAMQAVYDLHYIGWGQPSETSADIFADLTLDLPRNFVQSPNVHLR